MSDDSFAWVIVDDGESGLIYFAGLGFWSADNLNALRFLRKMDADRMLVSLALPPDASARVEEHGWMKP